MERERKRGEREPSVSVRPIGTLAIRFYGRLCQTKTTTSLNGRRFCLLFFCVLLLARKHKNVFLCCRLAQFTSILTLAASRVSTVQVNKFQFFYLFVFVIFIFIFLPALKFLWLFKPICLDGL